MTDYSRRDFMKHGATGMAAAALGSAACIETAQATPKPRDDDYLKYLEEKEGQAHRAHLRNLYWIAAGDGRTGADFTFRLEGNEPTIYDCCHPGYWFSAGEVGRDVLLVFQNKKFKILNVVLVPKDTTGSFEAPKDSYLVSIGLEGTEPINEDHLIKTLLKKNTW